MDADEIPYEADADELARKIDAICCEYRAEAVYLAIAMIIGRAEAMPPAPDVDGLDATMAHIRKFAEVYFERAIAEDVMVQFDDDLA
jgi:hypothetical protein